MTDEARTNNGEPDEAGSEDASQHPEQQHEAHEAHGGSMAPGIVDDTGQRTGSAPPTAE
jgi:hypothetical protein